MSDLTDGITEAEQLAAAAVPFAGPIIAVAGAITATDNLITLVDKQLTAPSDPEKVYAAQLHEYESIIDNPNEAQRDAQLGNFVNRLFLDAGIPVGVVGGQYRRVPVEYFDGFIQAAGQLIKERAERQSDANSVKQTTK